MLSSIPPAHVGDRRSNGTKGMALSVVSCRTQQQCQDITASVTLSFVHLGVGLIGRW